MAVAALSVVKGARAPRSPRRISWEVCLKLLGGASAGHLALSQGALPLVVPVSCAICGGQVLVRAGLGPLGAVLGQVGVVAFQTAVTSPDGDARWEIIVQGRAESVSGRGRALPPPLDLVPDHATAVLAVDMELVTGWEYAAAEKAGTSIGRKQ